MRELNTETWIMARARVKRGWLPMPRHAHGGRHASPATRRGRKLISATINMGAKTW